MEGADTFENDVHAALGMASCILKGVIEQHSEESIDQAARLVPEVCREYGRDQDRR